MKRIEITATAAIVLSLIYFLFIIRYRHSFTASRTDVGIAQSLSSRQMPGTATPVSLLIDLSSVSPMRGAPSFARRPAPPAIPAIPSVNLILKLPLGSEDRSYSIRLNSRGSAIWFRIAKPHFNHGQMLLHAHADFSRVPPGAYELAVVAKDFRVSIPVLVNNISPANVRKP